MKVEKPKRKTDSAQPEAVKHPRADSGAASKPATQATIDAPPKQPPTIPFGTNPSPNAEILAKDLHGFPFYEWVNLQAVELFAQVDVSYLS
jgi:hypothetical protein